MKKGIVVLLALVVAAAILGTLYAFQPDRMTPERARLAYAAEEGLEEIQLSAAEQESEAADGEEIPDVFRVKFECSNGEFIAEFHKDWSPAGAARVYELCKIGFYDGARFFRVLKEPRPFMAQFGIAGDPKLHAEWSENYLPEEPVKQSNIRGRITFAMGSGQARAGRGYTNGTRSTQLFINYNDNSRLDDSGFAPVGEVIEGMDVVEDLYGGYGEGAPTGNGPDQGAMRKFGNAYLEESFPKLDFIKSTTILEDEEAAE